jgi:hypothetical protein
LIEVQSVARRAPAEAGRQRRRPALEVGIGAEHAVAVNHHAGVAEGEVLAAHRRHDGLVVDAGIGHHDAERFEGVDRSPLERGHGVGLFEALVVAKVDTARIGDHRDAHASFGLGTGGHIFEELDAGLAQRFGVGHDVRLGDFDEIGGVEKLADTHHVFDRPAPRLAELAGQHGLLLFVEFHRGQSFSESVDLISASV